MSFCVCIIYHQEEIIKGVRGESSSFIKFKELDKEDFKIPEHIDKVKLTKSIELQPVPYWRNESYRNMCNFWLKHFTKHRSRSRSSFAATTTKLYLEKGQIFARHALIG